MKKTLSVALLSVLLLMGASCEKTPETRSDTTAATLATVEAAAETTNTTTEAVNTNTNTTAPVTVTADDAAGVEDPAPQPTTTSTKTAGPAAETTKTTPEDTTKKFSKEDVAKHSSRNDCWLIIHGKVYDITDFIGEHPGGIIIATGCGKDATALFEMRPGGKGAHSSTARGKLATMEIGILK